MFRFRSIPSLLVALPLLAACSGNESTTSSTSTTTGAGGTNASATGAGGSSSTTGTGGGGGGGAANQCLGAGSTGFNTYKYAYFGDLHLHTSYSLDAYSFGTRSDPTNAYLFAKGQAVVHVGVGTDGQVGPDITQPRPLDFLAITDHSEWLMVTHGCTVDMASGYYDASDCGLVRSTTAIEQDGVFAGLGKIPKTLCDADPGDCQTQEKSAWQDIIHAADTANAPCTFTSLVAYEWTDSQQVVDSTTNMTTGVTNHRNVIFANDQVPTAPLDATDYPTPPALWTGLDAQCTSNSGCDVITIPHNTNLSAGVSLTVWDPSPKGLAQQEKYQVSAEVYQHKGSSECYYSPAEGYNDPDCQFEYVTNKKTAVNQGPKSFVREGLVSGLAYAAQNPAGGNPFKLGILGATDDHNGAPGNVDEATFVGHAGRNDDIPRKRLNSTPDFGSGALTGAWAEENTRDSIFSAIKRRETFATSGPRLSLRFYQTNNATACADPDFPKQIVDAQQAIPMGGTFPSTAFTGKPSFAVAVFPDALTQHLADDTVAVAGIAKVQIIKLHAHMTNGQPVMVEDPPYLVSGIPATGGCGTWTDTTFDPTEYSLYYVRAFQVPTWRWSHFSCSALKIANPTDWQTIVPDCVAGGPLDVSIQERGWTSPIYFEP
jgi:Protein of unknown function (DUF3604)